MTRYRRLNDVLELLAAEGQLPFLCNRIQVRLAGSHDMFGESLAGSVRGGSSILFIDEVRIGQHLPAIVE